VTRYEDVKHIDTCNMIWCKYLDQRNSLNQKCADRFEVIYMLFEHKDTLLEPISYDEQSVNIQIDDNVADYATL
jgi:hypothetical protein